MKELYYKNKPVIIGNYIKENNLIIKITDSLIEDNLNHFTYKEPIKYVQLIRSWFVDGEFMGEVFELSTLDNLSKFQQAPSKENFRQEIDLWIKEGYFQITTKEKFEEQELIRDAIFKGYDKCPKYLNYPWQKHYGIQKPNWNKRGFYYADNKLNYNNVTIYNKGEWAEIPYFITTDDGVDKFLDEDFWAVSKNDFSFIVQMVKNNPEYGITYFKRSDFMYFSTEELVHKYIKENKVKSLKDYENILNFDETVVDTDLSNEAWEMYGWLKRNEPKLYWSKVLQIIADNVNEYGGGNYFINYNFYDKDYSINSFSTIALCDVKFDSIETARKAIEIMGDKLDFIYR